MDIEKGFLERFKIKKPAKNEERKRLIQELSDTTGWNKKSIYFSTVGFPDSWLQDALNDCKHYSNPKMRNKMFKEFIDKTKI
jgi:hypothetical protein